MKSSLAFLITTGVLGLAWVPARADGQLSPERLDRVDQLGYFTPGFKREVHDLVDSKAALAKAGEENHKLTLELPALQQEATAVQAKATALRQELAKYEHPDETDFAALQVIMKDEKAKLPDQIALAQAYVWTYPASPHEADAQAFLTQAQKTLADAAQSQKDAEAKRAADYATLVKRAQAHDLSVNEWRDFLQNKSQDELVQLIGRPTSQSVDYWDYNGGWTTDAITHQKVGLQITFDAGRVLSVSEMPAQP
jgi:hypothetical protein